MMKRIALCMIALAAAGGCKKKTGGPTGGSWFVGPHGLMANMHDDGTLGAGYALGDDSNLQDIACRGADVAFVAGDHGAVLRTYDGGESWESIDLGADVTLRSIAAQREHTIYVAGDRTLAVSDDDGASWRTIDRGDYVSVTAGHWSYRALALDGAGRVISFDAVHGTLTPVAQLAGARVVAFSGDGTRAAILGAGTTALVSSDAGASFRSIELGARYDLNDAWVTAQGEVFAVGADGTVLTIDATGAISADHVSDTNLRTIRLEADGVGVVAGDDGQALRTVDHGLSWAPFGPNVGGAVSGVDTTNGDGW